MRPSDAPLRIAAEQGDGETVSGLVAAGVSLNTVERDGTTPLFIAAQKGHDEIVSSLVAAGADVNAPRHDGSTPLFIAAQNFRGNIVSVLVAAGADLNAATTDGATPLFVAAQEGYGEIASVLVEAGADLNAATQDGATPLFIAAQRGHVDAVLPLLIGGSRCPRLLELVRSWWAPEFSALLHSPPAAAPLVAAQRRLAWSGNVHERLGSGCLLGAACIDVVARVGHFVGVAVYRVLLRQAQLIYEFRCGTSAVSDDVARECLVDAGWDVLLATQRFQSRLPEGVPS